MTNKHYKGNEMIRRLVIGADFVILTSYCCSIPNMVKNSYQRISTKQQRLPFLLPMQPCS